VKTYVENKNVNLPRKTVTQYASYVNSNIRKNVNYTERTNGSRYFSSCRGGLFKASGQLDHQLELDERTTPVTQITTTAI